MTIAKRLREFRTTRHLTALEVANTLDIPARTIGSYERSEVLPGSKFYGLMIQKYNVNVNWLISGTGTMFINQNISENEDSISQLQEKIKFTNEQMNLLVDMLKSESSRSIFTKLIEIKKGNMSALDSLISDLQNLR